MRVSIKGIGCDIVSISRIAKVIVDQKFLDKVYTVYEQDYIYQKGALSPPIASTMIRIVHLISDCEGQSSVFFR